MSFAADRDLLAFEPSLFRDISWSGQRLISTSDGQLASGALTSAAADFLSAGVDTGAVAVVGAVSLEVLSRTDANTLQVSLLRASVSAPAIPPANASAAPVVITTFSPQITLVHNQLMRSLGVEPSDPTRSPAETDITNTAAFIDVEALGALHLIYAAAAAMVGDSSTLWIKASEHRKLFNKRRAQLVAELDLNGDGLPDARRRPNTLQFLRG